MTKFICLFGGPGSGKSTTAAGVFSRLKQEGYSVELVQEYAKDLAYDKNFDALSNQLHVFSEQFRRQYRLLDQVDWVITDSPLLLSSIYFEHYLENSKHNRFSKEYKELNIKYFDKSHFEFDNFNVFIERRKEFVQIGRLQNEQQSKEIDQLILNKFKLLNLTFDLYTNSQTSISDILKFIKS